MQVPDFIAKSLMASLEYQCKKEEWDDVSEFLSFMFLWGTIGVRKIQFRVWYTVVIPLGYLSCAQVSLLGLPALERSGDVCRLVREDLIVCKVTFMVVVPRLNFCLIS